MVPILTSPGFLKLPNTLVSTVRQCEDWFFRYASFPFPPSSQYNITHLIFLGGPMTNLLTVTGDIESYKLAHIDGMST